MVSERCPTMPGRFPRAAAGPLSLTSRPCTSPRMPAWRSRRPRIAPGCAQEVRDDRARRLHGWAGDEPAAMACALDRGCGAGSVHSGSVPQPRAILPLLPAGLFVLDGNGPGLSGHRHAAPSYRWKLGNGHPAAAGIWKQNSAADGTAVRSPVLRPALDLQLDATHEPAAPAA